MSDPLSRRQFFKVSGAVAAGAGLATGALPNAALAATTPDAGMTQLPYPRKALGLAAGMKVGEPVSRSPIRTIPPPALPCG